MLYQTTCLLSNAVPTDSSVDDHEQFFVIRWMYMSARTACNKDKLGCLTVAPCMGWL